MYKAKYFKYFSFYRDATRIIVRGNSSDFMARNNYDLNGKEAHIADVLTTLYNTRQEIIKPKEVILFDDDDENIAKDVLSYYKTKSEILDNIINEVKKINANKKIYKIKNDEKSRIII